MNKAYLFLPCALLSACSMEPHYTRPIAPIPTRWSGTPDTLPIATGPMPERTYHDIFRDPNLRTIIDQALSTNRDLRQAVANVAAAKALYRVQRAPLFPAIDAGAGSSTRQTLQAGAAGTGGTVTTYDLHAGTTAWEIDLFGRLRSLSHAAFDQYLGSKAASQAARLTLVAAVADAYLTLAADRSLLSVAIATEKSAQTTVGLTKIRLDGGVAPRSEMRQAQTVFYTASSDNARQETLVAQDRNALELLVGSPVDDTLLPDQIDKVGDLIGEMPPGMDTSILANRPDVAEAEYALRAANARIGAARAAAFPRISLSGLAGLSSKALSALFTGGALAATIAPSVTVPVLDWGISGGNIAYAKAQRDMYLAIYEKALQTSFREASDSLALRSTIDRQISIQILELNAAQDILSIELQRYREGLDSFLGTLDAQRTLYAAQITLVNVRAIKARNNIALYKTLGGNYGSPE